MAESKISVAEKSTFEGNKEKTVCFVCTGNTCRSPMAEAVFNDLARIPEICSMLDVEKAINRKRVHAISAGLSAWGDPISENAVSALKAAGIASLPDNDYEKHRSKNINPEIIETADLVVGISSAHTMALISAFPTYAGKITCMPRDIGDPYGSGLEEYCRTLEEIKEGVKKIYDEI